MATPLYITASNTTAEIFAADRQIADIIRDLEYKTISVLAWGDLQKDYDPKQHAVFTDKSYTDKVRHGKTEKMTRITYAVEKQSVKRMKELMFTIPVKRKYTTKDDNEKLAASIMEAVQEEPHRQPQPQASAQTLCLLRDFHHLVHAGRRDALRWAEEQRGSSDAGHSVRWTETSSTHALMSTTT